MKKRGQITIYIIIGIIILLAIAVSLYFLIPKQEVGLEEIPSDAVPIREFVTDCLQKTTITAFEKIGQHGGYIDPTNSEYTFRNLKFSIEEPTEGDGVSLFKEQPEFIPYWYQLKAPTKCTDCKPYIDYPSINLIEYQVNTYVNNNLANCLDNLSAFKEYEIDYGIPSTKTTINDEDITVNLEFPIVITYGKNEYKINKYVTRLDLNFKQIYSMAEQVMGYEIQNQFLETLMSNLISIHAGEGQELPPLSAYERGVEPQTKSWNLKEVKKQVKDYLITSEFNRITVQRTRNSNEITSKSAEAQAIYNFMNPDIFNQSYPTVEVNFMYLNWPIYFDVTPRNGESISPHIYEYKSDIPFYDSTKVVNYEFFYDISFPVIARFTDTSALNGKGYSFMIGLEENIINNRNLIQTAVGYGRYEYNPEPAEEVPQSENFEYNLCDNVFYITDVNLTVMDDENKIINGARLNYGCPGVGECEIGMSIDGKINQKLPTCYGGYAKIVKDGYKTEIVKMNSIGETIIKTVNLTKLKEFDYEVKLYRMSGPNSCCGSATELKDNETVTIQIAKQYNETDYDNTFSSVGMIERKGGKIQKSSPLQLTSGKFVAILNYNGNDITIDPKCISVCDSFDTETAQCNNWGEMDEEMTSASMFAMNQVNLTIIKEDLKKNKIEFYVLISPEPNCVMDEYPPATKCNLAKCIGVSELAKSLDYANTYADKLKPVIK